MTTITKRLCAMTACLLTGSILLADSDPLLDAVLSMEPPKKPAHATISPAGRPSVEAPPAKKGQGIQPDAIATPAPRATPRVKAETESPRTSDDVYRPDSDPDTNPSPVDGTGSVTTAADLETKAAPP